jgi:hypothetical protein
MNEGGTQYPQKMRWSTDASIGAVPTTWDETDATENAGFTIFGESTGDLVDCKPLRNNNVIYSTDSTWSMSYIGGNDIFSFTQIFKTSGLLSTGCVAEVLGKHICLTSGDVVAHNEGAIESIVNKRMQKWLFNQIDATNYDYSHVVPNYPKNEVWICFPSNGATHCDTALVWNYVDNSFGVRELPETPHIAYGAVDPSEDQTWDSDSQAWDLDTTVWNQRAYNPTENHLLISDPTNTKLFQVDSSNTFNGTAMTSYVEKTGIDFDDPTSVKRLTKLFIRGTFASTITVSIGVEMEKGTGYSYTNYTYDPADDKLDVRETGRFFAIKFQSTTDTSWSLHSFDAQFEIKGKR